MVAHNALSALFRTWQQHRLAQVRALLAGNGHNPDPAVIARRLDPPCTPEAAEYYLEVAHATRTD